MAMTTAMQEALSNLQILNGQVTNQIIQDLIADHQAVRQKMILLYERYKATQEGLPIFNRTFEDTNKINNQINNDFFGDIIDTKVGYFAGMPIAYQVDKEAENHEAIQDMISDFNIRNNIEDLDSETAKMAAICGYAARLMYIDREGKERVMSVLPWECIFVTDRSINEPQFALRYYTIRVNGENRTRVEWYDDTMVTFYVTDEKDQFVIDDTEAPKLHLFSEVPLFGILNNEEQQGDAEKVLNLIDAYDNTLSDVNSELEQFRLAYLAFYGYEPDEEVMAAAKRTGAFGLDAEGKIEFITKQLNDVVIENHLNRLEDNILRFAKSVNFNDESFGGNQSGVAMKFKLFGLESKCITSERKMTAALRHQYKILASAWSKKGITFDYINVFFQFKRNFPLNLLDEAQSSAQLKGLVSEKTRLSMLSFVDDVDYELEEIKQELEDSLSYQVEMPVQNGSVVNG